MKYKLYYLNLPIAILLSVIPLLKATSQELLIKSISLKGTDVILNYDLLDENVDHKFRLSLYSSEDNYVKPLKFVEGDIGVDQQVGGNKQIIWHAGQELGEDYQGEIALELKGGLYIPFVTLNNFEDINLMKKGRPYKVTWAAGRGSSVLTFDLYNKNNEIVYTYTNVANVGEYEINIPKDVKPGKNYRFKISDQRNKEDVVYTPYFTVKRKVPMYVNLALLGLVGTVSYLFLSNPTTGEPDSGVEALLPDPVTPF